ncbi:hypothetical protein OHC33_003213 [Knufia fluminis]|uniref:Phenol 2-monooxygenase n=1 Tax=Knufia fluminis TaxID=191047 RepID=A0AAN8EPE2_9EURO|nr:hypothetical protein OHC33_003213 [Knufia fluminis]
MTKLKTSYHDLVIVGAGPAGLMAASWASRLQLNTRVLDDKADRVSNGRADGLHVRTLEILDSFGLATPIQEAAYQLREICCWNPDSDDENEIRRTERVLSKEEDLGRYCQMGIHQGFIEQSFLDFLENKNHVQVERIVKTQSLDFDKASATDGNAHPITLRIRHQPSVSKGSKLDGDDELDPLDEIIQTKYLLGTDGGHSWVRKQLNLKMNGDRTKKHFGVIDIIPISDFPDVRISCSIHSTKHGSIMTIPREGRLVRFYVQLAETGGDQDDFDTSKITPETIAEKASKILSPYKLSFSHCDWWSIYTVGQQYASKFDVGNRIFLAGDAVHTHSPTMGAGMNVSMQDTYNLVWKLGQVIKGIAQPHILDTYNSERQAVATQLIELDRKMSNFYSDAPGAEALEYDKFREQFTRFLSGVSVQYGPNVLVPATDQSKHHSKPSLASNIIVGQRLPSHLVMNHAEANIVHAHSLLPSDGRWRVLILAGDISKPSQMSRLQGLCSYLTSPASFVHTYTPASSRIDSVIEILTVHAAPRHEVELLDLPEILHLFDSKLGYDYWKVFSNNNNSEEGDFDDAYELWGVGKDQGCIAVVRPDQHVSYLCELEDVELLERYFDQILVPQKKEN